MKSEGEANQSGMWVLGSQPKQRERGYQYRKTKPVPGKPASVVCSVCFFLIFWCEAPSVVPIIKTFWHSRWVHSPVTQSGAGGM